jgi:hypothetical protein
MCCDSCEWKEQQESTDDTDDTEDASDARLESINWAGPALDVNSNNSFQLWEPLCNLPDLRNLSSETAGARPP